MKLAVLWLACLLSWSAPSHAGSQTQAEDFVRGIYSAYAKDAPGPLDPRLASRIFSPALLSLITQDQRGHHGDAGKLDSDPVCDCQDPDGLRLASLKIAPLPNGRLHASVRLQFSSSTSQVELVLAKMPSGWRVDDISSRGIKSLKHFLSTP